VVKENRIAAPRSSFADTSARSFAAEALTVRQTEEQTSAGAVEPVARLPAAVGDREDADELIVVDEEDHVREPVGADLAVRPSRAPDRVTVRAFGEAFDRPIDFRG